MLDLLNRLRLWAGVDRPVFYVATGRGWSLVSGPLTILLMARCFTLEEQGYFYTFIGVLGVQVFLELGFSQCVTQFASHEFAHLRFLPGGALEGGAKARARLISLGQLSLKWYGVMSLLVIVGLGAGGHWFMMAKNDPSVAWSQAWWCLCVTTGLTLALSPIGALLEGCNQLAFLYGLRTLSAILASLVLWAALWGGAGLFAGAVMMFSSVLAAAVAYAGRWRGLLGELCRPAKGEAVSWRREIWPFQWRIAISGLSGYFIFYFFVPVLFYFQSPAVAGRMGATLQLVNGLSLLAFAWTGTKGPRYGVLISRREFGELDRLFYKATAQAVGVSVVGGAALLAGLAVVRSHFAIGARFLGVGPAALLVLAVVVNQLIFGQAVYLRAHKQEPFVWVSLANGLVTGGLVIILGRLYGAWGVCLGYSLVQLALLAWTTAVWKRCRRIWHLPGGLSCPRDEPAASGARG
jgi:O-antigen/teichoic acid export membrane protein